MTLRDLIIQHEREVLHLYRDSMGHMTGGVGHNYDDGISRAVSQFQLDDDIATTRQGLSENYDWYVTLGNDSLVRQDAIVDMAFNIGVKGIGEFTKMIAAIRAKDWDAASNEMLESTWRRQVGDRALDLAQMMLTGEYPS